MSLWILLLVPLSILAGIVTLGIVGVVTLTAVNRYWPAS